MIDVQMTKGDVTRRGNWMQTATGGEFYPLDPRPEEVNIVDIAQALGKLCRFAGHCDRFYSVAEHCVHIAAHAPPGWKLTALLHDASEAYLVDLPRPIKVAFPEYASAEDKLMRVIAQRFRFVWPLPAEIKLLDNRILLDERDQVMRKPPREWGLDFEPLGVKLECWYPETATNMFLDAFESYFDVLAVAT